jgi:hypothetical protein
VLHNLINGYRGERLNAEKPACSSTLAAAGSVKKTFQQGPKRIG